jgi:hypothetical protein
MVALTPTDGLRPEEATMKLMSALTMGITGLATVGLLSLTNLSAGAQTDYAKRDEDAVDLVLMDDDDDDDTNDDTGGDTSNTGNSASTSDNTASNFTAVSRDRDLSRSDKTRDWTRDGAGDQKRDWSGNKTNDRSRSDTR